MVWWCGAWCVVVWCVVWWCGVVVWCVVVWWCGGVVVWCGGAWWWGGGLDVNGGPTHGQEPGFDEARVQQLAAFLALGADGLPASDRTLWT